MKKRRPPQQGRHHLTPTPEVLRLYQQGRRLRPGSDEYKAVEGNLQRLLGLSVFERTVFGRRSLICCSGQDLYPIPCGCALAEQWQEALEAADDEAVAAE
jgi:hypothetical protein